MVHKKGDKNMRNDGFFFAQLLWLCSEQNQALSLEMDVWIPERAYRKPQR